MKKLFKRAKKLFTDRQAWVRQIVVASIASAIAWQVGDLVLKNGGVVAAIICALSIRISLYKSVREGFGQIVGTAIGAGTHRPIGHQQHRRRPVEALQQNSERTTGRTRARNPASRRGI